MKVKVVRDFRDKYTLVIHRRGDVLEITDERYAELIAAGNYVFEIAQKAPESVSASDVSNESTDAGNTSETATNARDDGLDEMSVRELREYADKTYKMTFKAGMKKADMIEKLRRMERTSN